MFIRLFLEYPLETDKSVGLPSVKQANVAITLGDTRWTPNDSCVPVGFNRDYGTSKYCMYTCLWYIHNETDKSMVSKACGFTWGSHSKAHGLHAKLSRDRPTA